MSQTAIALGAHVFDVHVRPVEAIPEGQGAALVDQIRFSPAGAAMRHRTDTGQAGLGGPHHAAPWAPTRSVTFC